MPTVLSNNVFLGGNNNRLFYMGGNLCGKFQIGDEKLGYWLRGQMVGDDLEPVFNGKLYLPNGNGGGVIIDNFPKAATPDGWTRHQSSARDGYDLKNDAGEIIFGYRLRGNSCHVITNLYDDKGEKVASASDHSGLLVHKGPFWIG